MDACINLPVEYKVFGFEVGKKGTPHIQGYLYHNDRISMKQLKKSIPRAHLEKAKGRRNRIMTIAQRMVNSMSSVTYQ